MKCEKRVSFSSVVVPAREVDFIATDVEVRVREYPHDFCEEVVDEVVGCVFAGIHGTEVTIGLVVGVASC